MCFTLRQRGISDNQENIEGSSGEVTRNITVDCVIKLCFCVY